MTAVETVGLGLTAFTAVLALARSVYGDQRADLKLANGRIDQLAKDIKSCNDRHDHCRGDLAKVKKDLAATKRKLNRSIRPPIPRSPG